MGLRNLKQAPQLVVQRLERRLGELPVTVEWGRDGVQLGRRLVEGLVDRVEAHRDQVVALLDQAHAELGLPTRQVGPRDPGHHAAPVLGVRVPVATAGIRVPHDADVGEPAVVERMQDLQVVTQVPLPDLGSPEALTDHDRRQGFVGRGGELVGVAPGHVPGAQDLGSTPARSQGHEGPRRGAHRRGVEALEGAASLGESVQLGGRRGREDLTPHVVQVHQEHPTRTLRQDRGRRRDGGDESRKGSRHPPRVQDLHTVSLTDPRPIGQPRGCGIHTQGAPVLGTRAPVSLRGAVSARRLSSGSGPACRGPPAGHPGSRPASCSSR